MSATNQWGASVTASDSAAPLIVTARFDAASARLFQSLRDRYFPARLNITPAHCTLFHHLPGDRGAEVAASLRAATRDEPPMTFSTTGVRFLGRGVALEIDAPALSRRRNRLAAMWRDSLTPQDTQGFRPHVTVQNKVDPARARALRDELSASFAPVVGVVEGLDLWRYRGGPWDHAGVFPFAPS